LVVLGYLASKIRKLRKNGVKWALLCGLRVIWVRAGSGVDLYDLDGFSNFKKSFWRLLARRRNRTCLGNQHMALV
jgi:hypothetical protein